MPTTHAQRTASALRQLQCEYNALLTRAQGVGPGGLTYTTRRAIRRFRHWTQVPCSTADGRARLQRLRDLLPPEYTITQADIDRAAEAYPNRMYEPVRALLTRREAVLSTAAAIAAAPLPRPSLATEALPDLTFGVEIECFMPVGMGLTRLAQRVTEAGIDCRHEGYNHTQQSHWKVVTDGSLGDYARGCEVVSPILRGEAGFEQVRKVCDALVAAGCTVRRSCGLHVHVGARAEGVDFFKNLAAIYAKYEGAVLTFLAPSRAANIYAAPIRHMVQNRRDRIDAARTVDTTLQHLGAPQASGRSGSRYQSLNFCSYWQHGTVEFRHHQGTVDATKAVNWIKLCLRMAGAARRCNADAREGADLPAMLDFLAVPADEREYFAARAAHFAGRGRQYQERR